MDVNADRIAPANWRSEQVVYLDRQERALREIASYLRNGNSISSVDLLTEADVEELRILISLPDHELHERVKEQLKNPIMAGRYRLLSDVGLLDGLALMDGSTAIYACNPKAFWAVAKHDRLKEMEALIEKERRRQRRNDRVFSIVTLFLGAILGIIASNISEIISLLAS